uniref:antiviral reverse transcriptase Drt3b n=1 Tax=Marinobacterium profundum TaxID=1714300 RepID=UPI00083159FA|nr:antiviral reverse transcriptase Drt3b [Marinobacterium profundum]
MKKARKIKIDKKDYARAFLTDTSPSDVPVIFSNDGLYINHHIAQRNIKKDSCGFDILKSLYCTIVSPYDSSHASEQHKLSNQLEQTYPMKYKIIKNKNSLRTLSLIHPRSQKNYCEIYKKYSDAIISLCASSKFSIRAPFRVGSSFYAKDEEKLNKYKEINIETLENDLRRKHASSFYSYYGFDRLYKFFSSRRYTQLEKKYSCMWLLDVANCFDSIYTHTISWAVKNKDFIKSHVTMANQFCQELDTTIQRSNNNETNGIPIGSEFSRIFAEIIFQDIDKKIENYLINIKNITFGVDYEVIRYVDDYVIFSKSYEVARSVYEAIEDSLSSYNLYLSESKINKFERPFFTDKSRVVIGVNEALYDFESSLFKKESINGKRIYIPNKIINKHRFEQHFINKIKILMGNEAVEYSEISPYVIGSLYKRLLKFIESFKSNKSFFYESDDLVYLAKDTVLLILRLVFFFYNVSPTVSSSERVSRSIIVSENFFYKYIPSRLEMFRNDIMGHVVDLSFEKNNTDQRNGYISLEKLNIIIATGSFGRNHTIPSKKISANWKENIEFSYFDIICLLYYFKDNPEYESEREKLVDSAMSKLKKSNFNISKDSESAYIFLDVLTCPYVDRVKKKYLLTKYFSKYEKAAQVDEKSLEKFIDELEGTFWFVKWKNVDILKTLERKELRRPY